MKKVIIIIIILIVALSFGACKKDEEATINTETPTPITTAVATPTPTPTPTPVVSFSEGVPHEGIRPIAVVIDNQGEYCFPQAALSEAQIVYEFVVEGGITRYIGLFWKSEYDLVGPVRSARDYMLDFILPYDAIFVHNGGSPSALAQINYSDEVDSLDGTKAANGIFEDITDNPSNWQDTYTTSEKIDGYISDNDIKTETSLLGYPDYSKSDVILEQGIDANIINISYSPLSFSTYMYDKDKELYYRNRNGETHIDRNTNESLAVKNIIIQKVKNEIIEGDDSGRQALETIGNGEGYYCTLGKCIEVTWSKKDEISPTIYKDMDGNEIVLNEGNTWIQIVPLYIELLIL